MSGITGNFDTAIKESSRVLNIKGRVLPATLGVVRLCAELDDGTIVEGETNIPLAKRPIERVFFDPRTAEPLDEVIAAIRDADAIVLGPGSLYTSILPNFLSPASRTKSRTRTRREDLRLQRDDAAGRDRRHDGRPITSKHSSRRGTRVCDTSSSTTSRRHDCWRRTPRKARCPLGPTSSASPRSACSPCARSVISETETVRHDPDKPRRRRDRGDRRAVAERATLMKPASAYRRSSAYS